MSEPNRKIPTEKSLTIEEARQKIQSRRLLEPKTDVLAELEKLSVRDKVDDIVPLNRELTPREAAAYIDSMEHAPPNLTVEQKARYVAHQTGEDDAKK